MTARGGGRDSGVCCCCCCCCCFTMGPQHASLDVCGLHCLRAVRDREGVQRQCTEQLSAQPHGVLGRNSPSLRPPPFGPFVRVVSPLWLIGSVVLGQVGFLLVFRSTIAYGRYWNGNIALGGLYVNCAEFVRKVEYFVPHLASMLEGLVGLGYWFALVRLPHSLTDFTRRLHFFTLSVACAVRCVCIAAMMLLNGPPESRQTMKKK